MAIVLGGGIGGLSAAHYLLRRLPSANIKLFEASDRFGGWIRTEKPAGGNTVFESGPRTLRPIGPRGHNTLELCTELNLQHAIIPIKSTHPAANNRMLYVDGQLSPLPSSILSIFRTMPPFSKPLWYSLMQDLQTAAQSGLTDDTTYNFIERRFGTEMAKYAISAMLCGICAGDAKEISVKFLMKEPFELEQQYGSVLRGMLRSIMANKKSVNATSPSTSELVQQANKEKWRIYSFKGGMETLSDALIDNLRSQNVQLDLMSPCSSITFADNRAVVSIGDRTHETDCLISSLPSHQLAPLVQNQHPQLATELLDIPYVDVAVVNLQYDGELLDKPGFGFLVPPCENSQILGVIYDSCCFDIKGKTVLTVMMGGKWYGERLGQPTNEQLLNIATDQVKHILNISIAPEASKVNVLHKCIPQYVVGHSARIERIQSYIRDHALPIRLCGSAIEGVGVNDVIYSAKQAVLN